MMKLLAASALYVASVAAANATACAEGPSPDVNAMGLKWGPQHDQIAEVFPTFRELQIASDNLAIVWISPDDCRAADLGERAAKVEVILGKPVMLRASSQDYRLIQSYAASELARTRELRAIFPGMRARGNKIGADVEVIGVTASDYSAVDATARKARAAAVVGRPVELRLMP